MLLDRGPGLGGLFGGRAKTYAHLMERVSPCPNTQHTSLRAHQGEAPLRPSTGFHAVFFAAVELQQEHKNGMNNELPVFAWRLRGICYAVECQIFVFLRHAAVVQISYQSSFRESLQSEPCSFMAKMY